MSLLNEIKDSLGLRVVMVSKNRISSEIVSCGELRSRNKQRIPFLKSLLYDSASLNGIMIRYCEQLNTRLFNLADKFLRRITSVRNPCMQMKIYFYSVIYIICHTDHLRTACSIRISSVSDLWLTAENSTYL